MSDASLIFFDFAKMFSHFRFVKMILQIKLLPDVGQAASLVRTIQQANACCNSISEIAWSQKVFPRFRIHKEVYYSHKSIFGLSAHVVALCIGKVADAYKVDRKTKRIFRPKASITYDSRLLSFNEHTLSKLWQYYRCGPQCRVQYSHMGAQYKSPRKTKRDLLFSAREFRFKAYRS